MLYGHQPQHLSAVYAVLILPSMKNLLIVVLVLAALGLSAVAWSQYQELKDLRARQPVLVESGESLKKQLVKAEANVLELEKQLESARKPALLTKSEAAAVRPQSTEAAMGALLPGIAALMDRPEMQKMMAAQMKSQIERRYAQLFKQLNLGPEQTEKLKALLVEREAAAADVMMVAAQKGINPMQNPKELQKLVVESQAESDTAIKDLLGDNGYSQYQDYRKTEPQRNTVAQLQQNLGYTDVPLNSTQAVQLTQLLAETSPARTGNIAKDSDGRISVPGSMISDTAIERSRAFLNPTQVQGLADLKQQQELAAAARAKFMPNMNINVNQPATPQQPPK